MFFAVLLRGGFDAKYTIVSKYNSHFSLIFAIIRNSYFCKSLRCTVHTSMRRGYNGLEMNLWTFSIRHATRNDLAPKVDVSHCLPRFSWTQNASGNPHARIYTPEWLALSRTYQDIVMSPPSCQKSHHLGQGSKLFAPAFSRLAHGFIFLVIARITRIAWFHISCFSNIFMSFLTEKNS